MNELDIALERLHLCAFETDDARPNCGPMVALALEGDVEFVHACESHASGGYG